MWLNIWFVAVISGSVVCMYFDDFGDEQFSPTTVIYHQLPLNKYHPLFTKNFQRKMKALASKSIPSFAKYPFDNSPSLLPLEQGVIHYKLAPSKDRFHHNPKLFHGDNFFDSNIAIDHIQSASTDSPIETEIYHVQLPPVIVDHTGKYRRVPVDVLEGAVKGVQASTRLHPGVAQYPVNTQFPPHRVNNVQNYIQQGPAFHHISNKPVGNPQRELPAIHYHNQHYFPARNEHVIRYPPYTTAVGYGDQLPPRSAAKPLLTKIDNRPPRIPSANHKGNGSNPFSQRDNGVFGSLIGLQQANQNPPQGRSDIPILPNRQRLYDDSPALYNSPVFRLNKSTGTPKCANGTNTTFCLADKEYPSEIVRLAMNNNQFLLERILADPSDSSSIKLVEGGQSNNASINRQVEQESDNITQTEDGNYICPSKVTYSKPLRAANIDGEWKVVVNLKKTEGGAKYSQTVRLEECTSPESACNFLNGAINSRCVQKYNLQRLLVWSYEEGIHFDVFRLPIACSCQVRNLGDGLQ